MSRISMHLKKQHKKNVLVVVDTHAGVQMSRSREVPNFDIRTIIPALPQLSFEAMTFGFIRDAEEVRPKTGTSDMTATSAWKGKKRESGILMRPNTGASNMTSDTMVTSTGNEGRMADSEDTHSTLKGRDLFDELGNVESGA
jgi:hypothetical protein